MTIPLAPRRWEATICGESGAPGPFPGGQATARRLLAGVYFCPGVPKRYPSHVQCGGAKSFVDDLGLSRGVVLGRAAASLRSFETKPFDWQICPLWTDTSVALCVPVARALSPGPNLYPFPGQRGGLGGRAFFFASCKSLPCRAALSLGLFPSLKRGRGMAWGGGLFF